MPPAVEPKEKLLNVFPVFHPAGRANPGMVEIAGTTRHAGSSRKRRFAGSRALQGGSRHDYGDHEKQTKTLQ